MPASDHLTQLERDGTLLLSAVEVAGWDAAVPGLTWDVRTVVTHLGAVHRWSADLVRQARPSNETGGSQAFWPHGLTDAERAAWFAAGLVALVDVLRAAPADLTCYTMLRDVSARDFWLRRQAHETAIHRADVQAAAGSSPAEITADLPPGFAQSGLTELVGGFAGARAFAVDRDAAVLLHADDGASWRIGFSPARNTTSSAPSAAELGPADVTVAGPSAQLYLWAWNRPATVTVTGDAGVADLWHRVAIQ